MQGSPTVLLWTRWLSSLHKAGGWPRFWLEASFSTPANIKRVNFLLLGLHLFPKWSRKKGSKDSLHLKPKAVLGYKVPAPSQALLFRASA